MAELVDVIFGNDGAAVRSDGGATVTDHAVASVSPPDPDRARELGWDQPRAAAELDEGSWIEVDLSADLSVGGLVLDMLVRPGASVSAESPQGVAPSDPLADVVRAGPLRVCAAPRPDGLEIVVEALTVAGAVDLQSRKLTLGRLSWQRLTVAFTGTELVVFAGGRFVSRHVLAAPTRLAPAKVLTIGRRDEDASRATLPMAVAGLRLLDALPSDLLLEVDEARRRGDDELASLAARYPELMEGIDLGNDHDRFTGPGRHRSHPDAEFVWHPATGAHVLTGPIKDLWLEQGAQEGQLGYPLADVAPAAAWFDSWQQGATPLPPLARTPTSPQGTVAQFEGGLVVEFGGTAVPVIGQILMRWRAHGGAAGFLGRPTGDARDVDGDGLRQDFEGGTIWWHRDTGAHALFGAMRDAYEGCGGPRAAGFPISEQLTFDQITEDLPMSDQITDALMGLTLPCTVFVVQLAGGAPVARLVSAPMHRVWIAAAKELGAVLDDEAVRPSGVRVLSCENGVVVGVPGLEPLAITSLEIVLTSAMVPDADDGIKVFGADVTAELMVSSTVELEHVDGVSGVKGVPSVRSGDDARKVDLAVPRILVPRIGPDTKIRVTFEAWDHDTLSANDRLGGLDMSFDVDNMWGLADQQGGGGHDELSEGGDGAVRYEFRVAPPGPDPKLVPIDEFREHLWWRFANFETPSLDRDLFIETFEDVEARMSLGLDAAILEGFYQLVYEGSAAGGNCFGMSREAIRSNIGVGLWSAQLENIGPSTFVGNAQPALDPWIARRFNRGQGAQLSGAMLLHVLHSMANGSILDAGRVFDMCDARTGAREVVMLSMYSLLHGTGHAVVAYATARQSGGVRTIYVADPNTPWGHDPDGGPDWRAKESSRIDIRPDGGWQFVHLGGREHDSYRCAPGIPTATLMAVPTSVLLEPVRTPFDDVGSGLGWLTGALVLLSGAETTSMSMGQNPPPAFGSHVDSLWGLRDFSGSEVGPGVGWMSPSRMAETWGDRLAATPGLLRVPIHDGGSGEVYARTGRFPDEFAHDVRAVGGDDFGWELATSGHRFAAKGPVSTSASLSMNLGGLAGTAPRVRMEGEGGRVDLAFAYVPSRPGVADLAAIQTALPVGTDIVSRFEVRDAGRRLSVQPGAPMQDLEVRMLQQRGLPEAVIRLGSADADVRLDLRAADLVSPLGEQILERRAPDGDLLDRQIIAPIA